MCRSDSHIRCSYIECALCSVLKYFASVVGMPHFSEICGLSYVSEVSKAEGRIGQTTNVVIGGTVTDDSSNEWLALDKKVILDIY